jgi:acetylornithine deacetylase/succinyl-diaminopimelate desuccinylase-like protein
LKRRIGYRLIPVPTIQKYLAQHRRRFVEQLKSLVRFPSVSTQPERRRDVLACADWLGAHFRNLGLNVKLYPTKGNPILVARTPRARRADAPRVVVYGHYDVQPPEPIDLWKTPPFEPVERGGKLFGRGASDNKGQFFAHVKAVEAYLKTRTPLPVNLTFLIEGEEEVGSTNLAAFVRQHAKPLRADYVIVSDTSMFSRDHPTITYATRGIAALEVRVDGPSRDLHSGVFGGSVANPVIILARLLAACVDANGHVAVPGFYDEVRPLQKWERTQFRRLPFDERAYARFLGVPSLAGEKGYTTLERRWARPTFEINGVSGGYQGPGTKTIVPAWASAKITCRLVPDQKPEKVARMVSRYLRRICPPSVRLTITEGHHSCPFLESPSGPGARAAAAALKKAFGGEPVFVREGGSLPILDVFKRHLGGEIILVGLGLPDDNWHSPNEKMDLANFHRGIAMSAELLRELGSL